MNMRSVPAIVVFSTIALGAAPALAQHGGGHGGGGHGGHGGSHAPAGHAMVGGHGGTHVGGMVGHAVPRPHVSGPSHIVVAPYHPLIHGAFGLNYGYRNGYLYGYPYPYSFMYGSYGYGYGYPGYGAAYGASGAYGGVRIEGAPRDAQVFADGYYAGVVDDFDGVFQHLDLEPGPHQIEIRALEAPPIVFNVQVQPGRTITYRANIHP